MSRHHHHHHRHNAPERSGQRFARNFLAFALFLDIALLSLVLCVKFYFIEPSNIVNIFTNETYIGELTQDVNEYSKDLCRGCLIPEDTLDSVLEERTFYNIENAYISGALGSDEQFTETTYKDLVKSLQKEAQTAVSDLVKEENIKKDPKQQDGAKEMSDLLGEYVLKRVEIPHMDKAVQAFNIAKSATSIAMVVLIIVAAVLILIIVSIGEKRYRAVRNIVHSFSAAAILDLLLICGVEIIKHYKTLVLYPTYLAKSIMGYVSGCETVVGYSSLALLITAFVLAAVVWKMKRSPKK